MAALTIPAGTPALRTPVRGSARPRVRLTRRGRRLVRTVVVLTLVVLAFGGFVLGQGGVSVAGTASQGPATTRVVVQPGQSLWSIAADALPELDAREAVLRIADLNGLAPGARLTPGQGLILPVTS